MNMTGKVAVVIGSTSGIGKGMAITFAKAGAKVVVTGRREERGLAVVKEIEEIGSEAAYYCLDCMDIASFDEFSKWVANKFGRVDTLLYNAGITRIPQKNDTFSDNWDAVFTTNTKAMYFMANQFKSYLELTKGSVVLTSSTAGMSAVEGKNGYAYAASKAAVLHMTKIMALDFADAGIRVNSVAPGLTSTDILKNVPKETVEALASTIPLKKICEPYDIANAALFFASDLARLITGQIITVDGGNTIH